MSGALDEHDALFAALANPSRRAVLAWLAASGEGTATTIAAELPISRQAVVKHLASLERARLVAPRRAGREVRYQLQPGRLATAAREIDAIATGWDRALLAIKRVAEADPGGGEGWRK